MAHKCNMRQLFAIPASYENNIALAKPEGRYAHARIDPLFFGSHFLPWLCTFVQLSFSLFLLYDRVLLSARLLMLTFSSKGKAYLKRSVGPVILVFVHLVCLRAIVFNTILARTLTSSKFLCRIARGENVTSLLF